MTQPNVINRIRRALRSFVLGPGVIDQSEMSFGHDTSTFTPPEYGDYIATSNGVYTCSRLRAQSLSGLPLRLYRESANADRTEVTSGNLYNLLQKVNPFWTLNRLIEMTELSLCLYGKAFWFLERGNSARLPPREIWWGRSDNVVVVPHPTNYISEFIYKPANGYPDLHYSPQEVIWFRYPNPLDEYEGLAPMAAARLAADTSSAAMKSNYSLFTNGLQIGGALFPRQGQTFTLEQATDIEKDMERRFKGQDKAHKWGVFRFEADLKEVGTTPKDAEFLGALRWSLEDICRAFGIPLDMVGGERTYTNVQEAERAFWARTMQPEARFIATEINESLLPMFGGEADIAEFDVSEVEALHEAESASWTREKEQIIQGAITINEWRTEQGLDPVPWGDVWWSSGYMTPIEDAEVEPPPDTTPTDGTSATEDETQQDEEQAEPAPSGEPRVYHRIAEFGSTEHERLWQRYTQRTDPHEKAFGSMCAGLMRRQQESVLSRLRHGEHSAFDSSLEPFDMAQWVKEFRKKARPLYAEIIKAIAQAELADIGVGIAFDIYDPNVVRFIERATQRFATEVNQTTWDALKKAIAEGISNGDGISALEDRVTAIMADRIASSAETIARTEVEAAANGGTLESWRQSGVVEGKEWNAAMDERTRDTHKAAHGQVVGIEDSFRVGNGAGPTPGQIGLPEEDINCRCFMTAVLRKRS